MSSKNRCVLCGVVVSLVCALYVAVPRAYGQASAGAILGTVTDPSGAVIPNAEVTITNAATGQAQVVHTNSSGFYDLEALQAGAYNVTVKTEGFRAFVAEGVTLDVGGRVAVNASMQLGAATSEVTVAAAAVAVETSSGEQSTTIGSQQISTLALNGRNFISLAVLVPGVVSSIGAGQEMTGGGIVSGQPITANGVGREFTNFAQDGTFSNNTGCMCGPNVTPSLDTISEFNILKDNFSAKFGFTGSANIIVESKSGTGEFHGAAYNYLRNDALDARDTFTGKSPLKQNIFGFTIGGPVYIPGKYNTEKKKTFFFVGEEWRRVRRGQSLTGKMIPQDMRNGDFTNSPSFINPGGLAFDSASATLEATLHPGVNCRVDSTHLNPACFDPNAVALLSQYFPLPNTNNPLTANFNYVNNGSGVINQREDNYRIDHYFNDRMRLMGRISYEDVPILAPANTWGPNPAPTMRATLNWTGINSLLRFTHNISPTSVNQFTFAQTHDKPRLRVAGAQLSGLTIALPFAGADIHNRVPQINIEKGWSGLAAHPLPVDASDGEITFADDYSHIKGSHVIQAGGLLIFGIKRQNLFSQTNGTFGFSGVHSNDPVGDYLLGLDASLFQTNGERRGYFRYDQFEGYIQDDWKATRKLTLNLGLREVYYTSDKMEGLGFSDFDPKRWDPAKAPAVLSNGGFVFDANGNPLTATGQPADLSNGLVFPEGFKGGNGLPSGTPGVPDGIFVTPVWDLGPRFGFAYDLFGDGRTAIRGGYGIGYSRIPFGQYVSMNNLPFVNSVTRLNGTLTDPSLGTPQAKGPAPLNIIGPPGGTFKPTQLQTWSLGVQRELLHNGVLTVSYVGSGARHVKGSLDFNFPRTGIGPSINNPKCLQSGQDPNGIYDFDPCLNLGLVSADFTRPYVGWSGFSSAHGAGTYFGTSNYHSLQVGWKYTVSHLSWTAAYTFGKSLADVADRGAFSIGETGTGAQNMRKFKSEYGPVGWDRTHVFTSGYIYDLPLFRNRKDFVGKALGQWTFSGITVIESGFAFSPGLSTGTSGLASRANCVGNVAGPKSLSQWFNTAAFVAPAFGTFGNCGTGIIRGPGDNTWNWALYKSFPVGEKLKLQLRAESFNLWNHPNYVGVDTSFGSSSFGQLTSDLQPRILEFALRLDF